MQHMRIKELRKSMGLSQTELASLVGVTQTVVSDWEREIYLPHTIKLPELAKIFGCSIDELFAAEDTA